ncbi:hypothetical protein BD413DRAFT_611907 [Trametes elegans]|nr:hypothetical protein BD413DRAFT_611907 [Trametes elegans]
MPSEQLRRLNALLLETDQQLGAAVMDGLIARDQFGLLMWTTKSRIENLRILIYTSTGSWTFGYEWRCWKLGLSDQAVLLCKDLNDVQLRIARISAQKRMQLAASRNAAALVAQGFLRSSGTGLDAAEHPGDKLESPKLPNVNARGLDSAVEVEPIAHTEEKTVLSTPHGAPTTREVSTETTATNDQIFILYPSRPLPSNRRYSARRDVLVRSGRKLCTAELGFQPYPEDRKPRTSRIPFKEVAHFLRRGRAVGSRDGALSSSLHGHVATVIFPDLPYDEYDGDDESTG